MLGYLMRTRTEPGPLTERKLRLWACACVRQCWDGTVCPRCGGDGKPISGDDWERENGECDTCRGTGKVGGLTDKRSREAVLVAERYADGLATEEELARAHVAAGKVSLMPHSPPFEVELAWRCAGDISGLVANSGLPRWFSVSTKLAATQCALLRCVAGDPWRPKSIRGKFAIPSQGVPFVGTANGKDISGGYWENWDHETPQRWLAWQGGVVRRLAQRAYEGRDASLLPHIADNLEEAGCVDQDILNHLRGLARCWACLGEGGEKTNYAMGDKKLYLTCLICSGSGWVPSPCHAVRGCWAIDLLLGKG